MFGAAETIVKKRKAIDALEAEWLADVAEYDRSGAWRTDGFFGTAAALRHACHLDQTGAQQYVSVGRRLEDKDDLDARAVYLSKTLGGRWDLRGTIDPVTGEMIAGAVDAEMARDLQADDPRRMPQRRADALANICRHALERGELGESHGVRPHISIVVDVSELPWFGPAPTAPSIHADLRHDLSATSIEFLLCDCDLTRILMRGKSEVLDLGRSTPSPSPAQWKALVARDRHCQAPGCRRPPADCQAHHKWHYTRGGPTDLDNLELLCWQHHRKRHIHDNQARAAPPEDRHSWTIRSRIGGAPGP